MNQSDFVQSQLLEDIKKKQIHDIIGRDIELSRIVRVLSRDAKHHVCIVGEGGVGKSAIVHGLGYRMQQDSSIYGKDMLELNTDALANLIYADHQDKEQQEIFTELINSLKQTVLVLDNAQLLFSSDTLYSRRAVNLLKLIFNKQDLRLIMIVDPTTYRRVIEKDPILLRHLSTIRVNEPSIETAVKITQFKRTWYEKQYDIRLSEKTARDAVILSNRYIHDQHLPEKAIDLIEEAYAFAHSNQKKGITQDMLKTIISERTGIPVANISTSDRQKLLGLEDAIGSQVIGQDHAVRIISKVIRRSRTGIQDPKRPIGTFLFLGASGIGKTELAKALAQRVYDNESALIRIDMSEYSESHNVQRLLGAPPGYIGYEEGGQLTNPVWEQPYSLILLDEIEKAHAKVFDIFLQVFDEGRLTDGQGRTVDFKNTIIIATSNIGLDEIVDEYFGFEEQQRRDYIQNSVIPLMLEYFRPEFVNRFDEIVIFKPLDLEDLVHIGRLQIEEVQKRLEDKKITLNVSDEILTFLAQSSYNPKFGARPLKRFIREKIEDIIAEKLITGELKEGYELRF